MVNFQLVYDFHGVLEKNFTFSPLEQEVTDAAKLSYLNHDW